MKGPLAILGGGAVSYEQGTPVCTGLLWGPRGGRFLMSEVPLYTPIPDLYTITHTQARGQGPRAGGQGGRGANFPG